MTRIAIVGMACRYPDATSPRELWENALAGRRAFRAAARRGCGWTDYWDADPSAPDRFYARNGRGHRGLRVRPGRLQDRRQHVPLHRPDPLARAGHRRPGAGRRRLPGRRGPAPGAHRRGRRQQPHRRVLPGQRRCGCAGRTCAGRSPPRCSEQGWDDDRLGDVPGRAGGARTRRPFPAIDEDTLAGGLSNTIAGRICNHFDLNGGGYTVDGACSSSLLSVATACNALVDGELDVAVAGGVDLSHRPVRDHRLRQDRRAGHAARCGSTTAAPTASGPARAAACWC